MKLPLLMLLRPPSLLLPLLLLSDKATVIAYAPGCIEISDMTWRFAEISKGTGSSEAYQDAGSSENTQPAGLSGNTGNTCVSGTTISTEATQANGSSKSTQPLVLDVKINGYGQADISLNTCHDAVDVHLDLA